MRRKLDCLSRVMVLIVEKSRFCGLGGDAWGSFPERYDKS